MSGPRSLLIMPANRESMLAKAPSYGADGLVFDLEDSVPLAEKEQARQLAPQYIERHRDHALIHVRINAWTTGLAADDIEAIVMEGVSTLRVPKVESPDELREVASLVSEWERRRGLAKGSITLSPCLETAKGVWFAYDILTATPRVSMVVFGAGQDGDLQADLGYEWSAAGDEIIYARSRVLLAARAAGLPTIHDSAFANYRDSEALHVSARAARKLGYTGKSVIHPSQIAVVNEVFSPTPEQVAYYRRLLETFDAALARGSASVGLDGKMIDYAMVKTARRVLAWADETHGN